MKKIVVYDDDGAFTEEVTKSICGIGAARECDVKALPDTEFVEAMARLAFRANEMRKGNEFSEGDCEFDDADIAIIDQDLLGSTAGRFVTGEAVAYLLRCFSACKVIVVLNQYEKRDQSAFDLTLKGHPDSFADLNIGSKHIHNPNLWGERKGDFYPWSWPLLPKYANDYPSRVRDVEISLEKGSPIYEVLGVPRDLFSLLPRNAVQFLGQGMENATFRDFATDSGSGVMPKDSPNVLAKVIARVGAARISKWLERIVLPLGTILVDAPHLVSRYPSVLRGKASSLATWNSTAKRDLVNTTEVVDKVLTKHMFSRGHWISRPAWIWPGVSSDPSIDEVKEPWRTSGVPFCFCEDASRFYRPRDCKRFIAEIDSPYLQRFVRRFDDVDYRPAVRFTI